MLVVLLFLGSVANCFLLDDVPCLADSPCTCSRSHIRCSTLALTDVPIFNDTARDFHGMQVHLDNNQITTIRNLAFGPLGHKSQSNMMIYLQNNNIVNISEHAFMLVQNGVVFLNLEHNKLVALPEAVKYLNHLKTLLLAYNPLHQIMAAFLHPIAGTLQYFSFGWSNDHFPATALEQLRQVQDLRIEPYEAMYFPKTAFSHLSSLKTLVIGRSNLTSIPLAVCNVRHLETIAFDTSSVDSDYIVPDCRHHMTNLNSLTLTGDGLFHFPTHIFDTFPNIHTLSLERMSNTFGELEYAHIPQNKVTTLILRGDHLVTIPEEVSKFSQLTELDLRSNNIQCGCLMKWMDNWARKDNVTIIGSCANYNNLTIQVFVQKDLDVFCH